MFMYLVLTFFAFEILLENVLVVITINHLGDRAVSRSPIINYHYEYKTIAVNNQSVFSQNEL